MKEKNLCDDCQNGAQECCSCDYYHINFLHRKYPDNEILSQVFSVVSERTEEMIRNQVHDPADEDEPDDWNDNSEDEPEEDDEDEE